MGPEDFHRVCAIEHNAMTSIIDDDAPATAFSFTDHYYQHFPKKSIQNLHVSIWIKTMDLLGSEPNSENISSYLYDKYFTFPEIEDI
ncbi:hypothetical protein QTP88_018311 [Uroleucon formosanum]